MGSAKAEALAMVTAFGPPRRVVSWMQPHPRLEVLRSSDGRDSVCAFVSSWVFFDRISGLKPDLQDYLFIGTIVPVPAPCVLCAPYLSFTTFAFPKR